MAGCAALCPRFLTLQCLILKQSSEPQLPQLLMHTQWSKLHGSQHSHFLNGHENTKHSPPVHAALVVLVPTGQAAQHGAAHILLQADGTALAATAGTVPYALRHSDDWDGRNGSFACTCGEQAMACRGQRVADSDQEGL